MIGGQNEPEKVRRKNFRVGNPSDKQHSIRALGTRRLFVAPQRGNLMLILTLESSISPPPRVESMWTHVSLDSCCSLQMEPHGRSVPRGCIDGDTMV
jgi:hypothetical protein